MKKTILFPALLLAVLGGFVFFAHAEQNTTSYCSDDNQEMWQKADRLNKEGLALMDRQNWSDAASKFEQAVQIAPTYSDAFLNLGICYFQLKRYDEAIVQFDNALNAQTEWSMASQAWLMKGNCYLAVRRWPEAEDSFQEAATRNPQDPAPYVRISEIHCHHGDRQKCRASIKEGLQRFPDDPDLNLAFGNLQIAEGDPEAKTTWEKIKTLSPNCPGLYGRLASAHFLAKDYPKARQYAEQDLQGNPGSTESHWVLGNVCYETKDWACARTHLNSLASSKGHGFEMDSKYLLLKVDLESKQTVDIAARSEELKAFAPDNPLWLERIGALLAPYDLELANTYYRSARTLYQQQGDRNGVERMNVCLTPIVNTPDIPQTPNP